MEFQQHRRVEPIGRGPTGPPFGSAPTERSRGSGHRQVDPASRQQGAGRQDRLLRQQQRRPRHDDLRQAVHRLDVGLDEQARRQLAGWVSEQYAVEYGDIPLGFLAVCYLGPPYVDHRLDLIHVIVEHFGPSDPVPAPFDGARMMVRSGGYAFVEVYASGELVPILSDGTPVTS